MKNLLLALICLNVLPGYSNSQQKPEKLIIDKAGLTSTIDRLAEEYNIPDFAIALVNKDSILFTYDKNPENAGKNYLIGSCSKSFTALAIMKLVDEGLVELDKPVKIYLPWFEMKNPDYTQKVRVRDLLNQKSGIERQYGFFDPKTESLRDYEIQLAAYIKKIDVRFTPGTAFLYSNLNYVLLGLIVKHVTGQSFDDFMQLNLMPVIGMKNTCFTMNDNVARNLIQPYQYSIWFRPLKSRSYYYSDYMIAAGYIGSNINDLDRYMRFMLNQTITPAGDSVLTPESYMALTGKGNTGYAMGWFRFEEDSVEIITHTGLDENFSSSLSFLPELELGSIILCNINSLEFCGKVDQEIRSMILGKTTPASPVSFEKILRWSAFIIPLLIGIGLIFKLVRWRRNGNRFGFIPRFLPNLRLFIAILLSIFLLVAVTKMYQMFITNSIRFQPDIGWGLVLIALLGVTSAFVHYFGTVGNSKE